MQSSLYGRTANLIMARCLRSSYDVDRPRAMWSSRSGLTGPPMVLPGSSSLYSQVSFMTLPPTSAPRKRLQMCSAATRRFPVPVYTVAGLLRCACPEPLACAAFARVFHRLCPVPRGS